MLGLNPQFLEGREDSHRVFGSGRDDQTRDGVPDIVWELLGQAKVDQGDLPAANAASIETRKRIAKLQETTSTHPHGEALVWIATEYANVLDSRRALHEKANPEWLAFVSRLGDSISSDPTFDGWGVGWLRLRRLERDARENHREGLAALLQEHLNQLPEPSDAQ